MKTLIILLIITLFIAACATERHEIGLTQITIIKIDTVYRFGGNELALTLRDDRSRVEYYFFASIKDAFIVGTHYQMMYKR